MVQGQLSISAPLIKQWPEESHSHGQRLPEPAESGWEAGWKMSESIRERHLEPGDKQGWWPQPTHHPLHLGCSVQCPKWVTFNPVVLWEQPFPSESRENPSHCSLPKLQQVPIEDLNQAPTCCSLVLCYFPVNDLSEAAASGQSC